MKQLAPEERQEVIRIRLAQEETRRLGQTFRREADPKYRDRIPIVRLASRDRPHKDIAADLAITTRSAQRWLDAYLERGLDGLRPRKAEGATGRTPAGLAEEVKRWVIEGPAKQGLDRANWTHEELADHLLKTKGIRTSRAAVGRFCRKIAIRPYRPTDRYLRGKPEKRAEARRDIAELDRQSLGEGAGPSRNGRPFVQQPMSLPPAPASLVATPRAIGRTGSIDEVPAALILAAIDRPLRSDGVPPARGVYPSSRANSSLTRR